jgi:hypothetical protein
MVEKEQAGRAKLTNTTFKNTTSQQPKTAVVDAADTSDKTDTFNNRDKGNGKGRQEPVPELQPSTSSDQGKKTKKEIDFSKPPMTPCWECHQMGHWSCNCPIKAKMMAQFMQQNSGAGVMPLHQMAAGPDNGQLSGNTNAGWMLTDPT